jgi:hypothetical protein
MHTSAQNGFGVVTILRTFDPIGEMRFHRLL